jgi:hypothetical protein
MALRKSESLITHNKTLLLNELADYYTLSRLFFELDYDIIVTGNEQYANAEMLNKAENERRLLTERINSILEGTPCGDPLR